MGGKQLALLEHRIQAVVVEVKGRILELVVMVAQEL